jgi:acyl transferase domain-containing protein
VRDIAIVGLSCRLPGASDPAAFWELLVEGRDATEPMPAERARLDPAFDTGKLAGSPTPGGYLADVEMFDAEFFNVAPRQAGAMDPRQRLGLELAWETLDNAGMATDRDDQRSVGIFIGSMNDDYALLTQRLRPETISQHSFAGVSRSIIANRISHFFGFRGPSVTIDSGQASSLVAIHLACASLRSGESEMAVAGGIQLNLAAETLMLERELGALSVSGHAYPFDRRADGYVRGEGGVLVLLKPLEQAIADGDRIRAVIRGSAVGNAGATGAALTVPSATAQAQTIARAHAAAEVDSTGIGYLELHGTGTKVGDPVEAAGLGLVFENRCNQPVLVGSVKGNIGHLGAGAGAAGLQNAVLAL